jgi:hypothetical protein
VIDGNDDDDYGWKNGDARCASSYWSDYYGALPVDVPLAPGHHLVNSDLTPIHLHLHERPYFLVSQRTSM